MLSWIFRHRQRLSAIYGSVQPPPLAGSRLSERRPGKAEFASVDRPGHLVRRGARVEVRPMPPRAR